MPDNRDPEISLDIRSGWGGNGTQPSREPEMPIERQLREIKQRLGNLEGAVQNTLDYLMKAMQRNDTRLDVVERLVLKNAAKLPPLNQITRIKVEYFDNFAKNAATRQRTGKPGKLPNHQIKLQVWTAQMMKGTYFVTLRPPGHKEFSRQFRHKLDDLTNTRLAGCNFTSTGEPTPIVAIWPDWRMTMATADGVIEFEVGQQPPTNAQLGTHRRLWTWIPT